MFVKLRFWFWILYEVVIILGRIKAGFIALRIKIGIFIDLVKLFSPILIFLLSIDLNFFIVIFVWTLKILIHRCDSAAILLLFYFTLISLCQLPFRFLQLILLFLASLTSSKSLFSAIFPFVIRRELKGWLPTRPTDFSQIFIWLVLGVRCWFAYVSDKLFYLNSDLFSSIF